jgi:transcriptional regulator with XRE-family HTH domain
MNGREDVSPIGARLKQLRKQQGWTLTEVAGRTGISQGTLSKLENGHTRLNFTSVAKLASGLGLPVSAFTNPVAPGEVAGSRRSVARAGGGVKFRALDVDYEVLADGLAGMNRAFLRARIKQHGDTASVPFRRHPGQEFLYVISGTLELQTEAYAPLRLDEGDSVVFDSDMGHRYVSISDPDTVILIEMDIDNYSTSIEDLAF